VCTASWLTRSGALSLFFNRDELRNREAARPPERFATDGVSWLAPVDGRAGGTWIAAADSGLALALLNRSEGTPPARARSRGVLIPRLIAAGAPDELAGRLTAATLDHYPPFRLLALWHEAERGLVAAWDGHQLDLDETDAALGLLCSSGLGDERAARERGRVWARLRAERPAWDPAAHRDFHRDHRPEPSAWSVCVHRDDARSVSFTEIEIEPRRVTLRYQGSPPCEDGRVHVATLARTAGGAAESL
jgi:hypothetical protein